MYYDVYLARGRDASELTSVARSHRYQNPGPIIAFPPNRGLFPPTVSPGAFVPGATVLIPWHPDVLRKLIATEAHLAREVARDATELIEGQRMSRERLEQFLVMIDAVCMLVNVGKGIGELIAHGAKHGQMTAAQLINWMVNSRIETASDITTLAVPAPSEPKKDIRFIVRHTLGPWTPSFWASVYVAIKTGDVDIYLYGPAAVEHQTKLKIKQQADMEIARLQGTIRDANQQLGMGFYSVRI